MEIFHISYKEIDRKKWDACICHSTYGSLYATSVYLDAIAGKWSALITADYKIVMPLIYNTKGGINYLYQPAFLPMSGLFSREQISQDIVNEFLKKTFAIFKFAEIAIAYPVNVFPLNKNMQIKLLSNYIVDLSADYKSTTEKHHPNFKKSLRRLQKLSMQYIISDDIDEIMILYTELYFKRILGLKKMAVDNFFKYCKTLKSGNNIFIRKAYDSNRTLLASVLLLRFRNRIYNMISCITAAGKKAEANYFLYDKIIEEFSGKGMVLDLEGSDIKGIADFYLKMNPKNEQYSFVKYNNLPLLLKLIKK